jgi:hypothetical protein
MILLRLRLMLLVLVFGLVGTDMLHIAVTWDDHLESGLPGFHLVRLLCEKYNLELILLVIGTLLAVWHAGEIVIMGIRQLRR